MDTERRQHTRQKLQSPELLDMGAENGGLVVDIGEQGLGFQLVTPIETGRTVNLAFSLGSNQLIRAQARIAWVSGEGKIGGMEFTGVPEFTRRHMEMWLEQFSPESHGSPAAAPAPREEPPVLRPGPFPGAIMRGELGMSLRAAAATHAPATTVASATAAAAAAPATQTAPARVAAMAASSIAPPVAQTAPPLDEVANPFARATGGVFSRSPYAAEPSATDARGHKRLAAFTLLGLFIIACYTAAEVFPSAPRRAMAGIEALPKVIFGGAKARVAQPPENPAPAVSAGASAASKAPAEKASAPASPLAKVDPFSVAAARPVKKTTASSEISRIYARGVPGAAGAPSRVAATGAGTPAAQKPAKPISSVAVPVAPAAGAAEYQRGEKYLSGRGIPRDATQAVHWFWLSEGDGYTPAAVALAKLYLSGEGVSRSCLQAKVLLTAAAEEHNKDAARMLAQLPENCN